MIETRPALDAGAGTMPSGSMVAVGRRAGWTLADQAVSSATNFVIVLLAARSLSVTDFGAFGLLFATYVVILGIVRAATSQPLVIRYSTGPKDRWRKGTAEATGTAVVAGLALGTVTAISGLILGGDIGDALTVLGVFLPWLLLQDIWRFALFARARPAAAFANDVVWSIALVPTLGVIVLTDRESTAMFFAAWGLSGSAAALVGVFQVRVTPSLGAPIRWLRRQADLAAPLTGEFVLSGGVEQLVLWGVGIAAGLGAVGALRGAEALFGPVNVFVIGLALVAVPEGARMLERSTSPVLRLSAAVGVAAGFITVVVGGILLSLPEQMGSALLGATWPSASALLLPVMLARVGTSLASGAMAGLRSLAAGRAILMVRVKVAPLTILLGVGAAAYTRTARGAATGIAVAQLLGAAVAWRAFIRALHRTRRAREAADPAS